MTTTPGTGDYASIRAQLAAVRSRWLTANWTAAATAFVASVLGAVLFIGVIEGLFHLPSFGRWALLVASGAIIVASFFLWVIRPVMRRYSDQQVARYVESRLIDTDLRNSLINSVQLATDAKVVSPTLAERAIAESAQLVSTHDLSAAVEYRPFYRRLAVAGALAFVLVLFTIFLPGRLGNALTRVLHPGNSQLGIVGSVGRIEVTPGDADIALGEPFEVRVRVVNGPKERLPEARLESVYEQGRRVDTLTPSGDTFVYRMEAVEAGFRYCAWVGDSRSEMFTVTVSARPFVDTVDLAYQYPAYTGIEARTEKGSKTGAVEAPEGTTVNLTAHPSRAVARGEVRFSDGARPVTLQSEPTGDALTGSVRVMLPASRDYSFYLEDRTGHGSQEAARRPIRAIPDRPPVVNIIQPASDTAVAPGATVELAIRAGDDYGLSKVILWVKRNDETEVAAKTWEMFQRQARVSPTESTQASETLVYKMKLDEAAYRVGERLCFRAQAFDNCTLIRPDAPPDQPTFQSASSNVRTINIRDAEAEKKRLAEDVRNWQSRVEEILKLQREAETAAGEIKGGADRQGLRSAGAGLVTAQTAIQKKTATLVVDMEELTGEVLRTVRTALAVLARNDMTVAVGQAQKIAQIEAAADVVRTQTDLLATQAHIIKVLSEIMGVLPAAVAEQLAAAEPDKPTSMPPDAAAKWRALADKLKEFTDQQKKVIEDTSNLFKKNVDDFTDADKEKLKELAAIQDDWAKFLKEAHADLSKIPDQDFSNPSLLKELMQVVTDLEKAQDALTRKPTEMAVPLEQAGVENAKEMTTHIEKWLMDTADRLQWKMEEPIEDLDAPMAELPKELEDIVGKLMEEEEDLFEEVEDTSSAWTDSIDKGAGWDAMDGPISNMSAQGVTGNQLPNNSEIGGRSGEGRTGKSSGEMVGDEAVGKGGRRTPTRLTADPYQKGEVKDSSTEPAGGATGGGKVSGAGEQGLEGPVPAPLAKKMQRLAGQQAALRNQAERVQIGFKVLNYPKGDMDRVVTVMKQVEDDLKNFRYKNVLRQRPVLLQGLQASRLMVKQELAVHTDSTATLPPEIQKEILDSADLAVPAEYEELVKKYYQSLAEP